MITLFEYLACSSYDQVHTSRFMVAFVYIFRGMWQWVWSCLAGDGVGESGGVGDVTCDANPYVFSWFGCGSVHCCMCVSEAVRVDTWSISHFETKAWRRLDGRMSFGFVIVPHRLICKLWNNIWIGLGGYNDNNSREVHVFTYKIPQYMYFYEFVFTIIVLLVLHFYLIYSFTFKHLRFILLFSIILRI